MSDECFALDFWRRCQGYADKFRIVEDQTETWEQAKTLGKEIAQKLGKQMRM